MKKKMFRIFTLCFFILCVLCVLTACGQTSGTQAIPEGTNQTRPKGTNELKVTTNIPEAVTVSGSGYYKYNEDIQATANIKKGYEFLGWYVNDDDCISNQKVYNGKMWNQDVELSAKVIKIPENIQSSGGHSSSNSSCTLTVESLDKNYGLVSLDNQGNQEKYVAKYKMGQTFKVLAYSNTSERFAGWYGLSGELITTNATFTMSMPYFDYTLIAVWGSMDTLWDSQKLFYNRVAEGYVVIEYKGDSTSVTIPSTFKQEPVVKIANNCFKNCQRLTSIAIPESVTRIGDYAFSGCTGLTSITIPNRVTSIGRSAFEGCPIETATSPLMALSFVNKSKLKTVVITNGTSIRTSEFEGCTNLTSITIPNSVTSIGISAFEGCTNLTSITIPDDVKKIANNCFKNCQSLTSITIPKSVTSIGTSAFEGCTGLTSITIPNSVTSIGFYAFEGCRRLTKVNITSIEKWLQICFDGYSSNPLYYAHNLYLNDELVIELVVPNNLISIGQFVFSGSGNLKSITIPNSVTSIGISAFANCTNLTSITIPNSVTSIGYGAFSGCTGLTNITLPNSVTSIVSSAFENCKNLTSITIPDSVTSIEQYAFSGCTGLKSITIGNSVTSIEDFAFEGCPIETATIPLVALSFVNKSKLKTVVITNGTSIGNSEFEGCTNLTSITLPDSLTSIKYRAFSGCTNLTSITIPNSVTSIGQGAFNNCTNLTSIIIPASVTSIGTSAFYDCTNLTSIIIPASVTSIGQYAFWGCGKVKRVYYGGAVDQYASLENKPSKGTVYYYSESEPVETGNYWHYVNDVPTIWQ